MHPRSPNLLACRTEEGARLELEVGRLGASSREHHVLPQPFAVVGREPPAQPLLAHSEVGRRHAYLQLLGNRIFCIDLESRTGIRWGADVLPAGWLPIGGAIQIGPYVLRAGADLPTDSVGLIPDGWNPLVAGSRGSSSPGWMVEVDGRTGFRWYIDRVITLVGRATSCKLQTADLSVSRFHCSLIATPEGLWVVDLLSREGTHLNGERVRWARVAGTAHLRLGTFGLRVTEVEPQEPGTNLVVSVPRVPGRSGPASSAVKRTVSVGKRPVAAPPPLPGPVLAPEPPWGAASAPDALPEALLRPLLGQLHHQQQQMYDHFQQTIVLLIQTLGNLQQHQAEMVQAELERLRQVTTEMQELRAQISRSSAAQAEAPPATVRPPAAVTPPAGGLPVGRAADPVELPRSRPTPVAAPGEPTAATQAPNGKHSREPSLPPRPPRPPETGSLPTNEAHLQLCQRMEELEKERVGRWDKILQFLQRK